MSKIKIIKSGPNKKSPNLHAAIRHLGVMIESVNDNVKLVAEQHGGIVKKLDIHTEMIGALAIDLSIVKQDVEFIKSSMKRKIDVEEFSMLEHRVALLEKRR